MAGALRVLNVAEKPSVAREAARVLSHGRAQRRNGRSPYHPNWHWTTTLTLASQTGERLSVQEMVFTAVSGHVEEVEFESPYHQWDTCSPLDLLDATHIPTRRYVPERNRQMVENLDMLARNSQVLVLWLDCDAEGEAIAEEVLRACSRAQPAWRAAASRLTPEAALRGVLVYRARFSALTGRDLFRACATLQRLDWRVVDAVVTRQEIDLRAGAAFTRWLTRRIRQRFPQVVRRSGVGTRGGRPVSAPGDVISYGPCQFPALGLVVKRYWEMRRFQKTPFWSIRITVRDGAATRTLSVPGEQALPSPTVLFYWDRGRLFDRDQAYELFLRVHDAASQEDCLRIDRVEARTVRRHKPLPLATVELQKQASRRLRIASERTMEVAERLYQGGYISYPRTETDRFDTSDKGVEELRALVALQGDDARWGAFAHALLSPAQGIAGFEAPRAGRCDDRAHPPIHPTKAAPPGTLSGDEERLYEYIVRRFLACCSRDATGQQTTASLGVHEAAGVPQPLERFTARGLRITHRGYLEVFSRYDTWSEWTLPAWLRQATVAPRDFCVAELRLVASWTEPPPLLSEADLIAAMDQHGIGTDATIAEHIKKIQERQYVMKQAVRAAHSEDADDEDEEGNEGAGGTGRPRPRNGRATPAAPVARFVPMKLGVALMEAFERCELSLGEPTLRAEQEARQKRIVHGEATARETLPALLRSFRQALERLMQRNTDFDRAFAVYFAEAPAPGAAGAGGTAVPTVPVVAAPTLAASPPLARSAQTPTT
ncbi:hypothetical protein CDCA_CDCA16G4151 [Cyanidium caldarium]|uniref:DNA topoisomerase n=1 Tax=Cyanidium caldarium TaxID=2771 RepID=A0AAV9J141_CYACA|nr:hypothetical protein CDCA_CDCA16G4151 [Cyanidium caldarium]